MASFSRNDTFDRLKHYVGVRLQQGVPLIDADWNEMEDIRKFELQAFLKWVIGNGVPMGNTGFRIQPLSESGKHKIVLTAEPLVNISQNAYKTIYGLSSLEVSGGALDFGQGSQMRRVQRIALPPAQITSLNLYSDTNPSISGQLVISANDSENLTVNFDNVQKLSDVIEKINQQAKNQTVGLTASICGPDYFDFDITGGDDSFLGAGRCLVEGWDVMNECNIRYSGQTLYGRDGLAARWGVAKLPPLTQPQVIPARDFVFLDVWERLVEPDEDSAQLVNPDIGMESCLRLKREWVVRVLRLTDLNKAQELKQNRARFDQYMRDMYTAEGVNTRERHAYYPLALLHWDNQAAPEFEPLVEETGFNLAALAAEIAEARGIKGSLGNRLDVSLTKDGQLQEQVVGNDQVKEAAIGNGHINANDKITEGKIQFSSDTGHDHRGGNYGKQIDAGGIAKDAIGNDHINANDKIAEGKIQFSSDIGHDHSGGDQGKPISADGIAADVKSKLIDLDRAFKVPLLRQTVFHRQYIPEVSGDDGGVAFDGTCIWVANRLSNNRVSKIDVTTNAVVAIVTGDSPSGIAFDGTYIWVANYGTNNVSKIDVTTNAVVATVAVGSWPYSIAFDGTYIWVVNFGTNNVSKIDVTTNAVVATVAVAYPSGIAFDGTYIWVASSWLDRVSKIDVAANTVVATVTVKGYPIGIAFDGTYIWVANCGSNSVSRVDIYKNIMVDCINIGYFAFWISFDGSHIWITGDSRLTKLRVRI